MKEFTFEEITTTLPDGTEGVCGEALSENGTPIVKKDPRIEIDTTLEVGQWYTLSFWININNLNTDYNVPLQVQDEVQYYPYTVERYWKKFVFTFKAEQESLAIQMSNYISSIRIYQVQLEKGKEATAYMPRNNNIAELIADSENNSEAIKKIKDLCYDNDMTYIDGGKIYTGTITSKQLNVSDLFAEDILVTGDFAVEHMLDDDTKYVFKSSDETFGLICGRLIRPIPEDDIWVIERGFSFTEISSTINTGTIYINLNNTKSVTGVFVLFMLSIDNYRAVLIGKNTDDTIYADIDIFDEINIDSDTTVNVEGDLTVNDKPVASDEWHELECGSNFKPYVTDVLPRYKRCGDIVYLEGEVKPTASITGSTTQYTICTLPEDCRPSRKVCQLCQGTGVNKWLLVVNTNGNVTFSRYGTNALANAETSVWLPFSVSFMTD